MCMFFLPHNTVIYTILQVSLYLIFYFFSAIFFCTNSKNEVISTQYGTCTLLRIFMQTFYIPN